MKKTLGLELFSFLSDTSLEARNEQIQNAYGMFIEHIDTISQVENDLTRVIKKLNITRATLVFLSTQIQHEQGKKRPEICLSSKNSIFS